MFVFTETDAVNSFSSETLLFGTVLPFYPLLSFQ